MKKFISALILPMTVCTGTAMAQQHYVETAKFTPERPVAGDSAQVFYNPEGSALQGLAPVNGVVWFYRNNAWETIDMPMRMVDSGWIGKMYIPEKAAIVIMTFNANGKTDKGNKWPHAAMVFDKQGQQMPTSYAAWGMLRTAFMKQDMPPAITDSAYIGDDVALFWMNNELKYYPDSRRHIYYPAMQLVKKERGAAADSIIFKQGKYVGSLPDVTESELMSVAKAFKNILGNNAAADSVNNIIDSKFPDGITARDQMIYKLFRASEKERDSLWQIFVQRWPLEKFQHVNTETTQLYYGKVFRAIVYQYVQRNQRLDILDKMMDNAPLVCLTEFHRLLIMNALDHDQIKMADAFPYSVKLVNHIDAYTNKRIGDNSNLYSPLQWRDYVLSLSVAAFMGHARLLHQQHNDKEALLWLNKVKEQPMAQRADFLSLYAQVLLATGHQQEALQVAENAARGNKASPEIITVLKQDYVAKHKSDKGFEAYFEGMKNPDDLNAEREALRAQMIRKDAPAFKLENLAGGNTELAKLKGKVVVLDFWATWCGPCKEAMPGMQMAVNKYANDKEVAFYFIATQETKPDYKAAIRQFLKDKNYNFSVLLDSKSKTTGHLDDAYNNFVRGMGFSGIPAKFIIDRHGVIRWMGSGYKGSPSALADEISYIIDLLKKEG
ncbi:redoxin domain-containing protein [Chitinophaga sp. Cy-1792]|uniref:redoxin domain-containing protein n=1 Tax=Chitinophaga sp. Cy-1792 TaxID=2608339 RepID=UPI0014204F4E|nr:redoxin domain-containing protein [Chitinophaga sp. Cy-1792]NIG55114.1 redoxin domain-containing protein [Chitinophaga sp. Cy-1792]